MTMCTPVGAQHGLAAKPFRLLSHNLMLCLQCRKTGPPITHTLHAPTGDIQPTVSQCLAKPRQQVCSVRLITRQVRVRTTQVSNSITLSAWTLPAQSPLPVRPLHKKAGHCSTCSAMKQAVQQAAQLLCVFCVCCIDSPKIA